MPMEYSMQLTGEQKALHSSLFNAIYCNHGVVDILSSQSEEDIRAVLTTLYWKSNDIHRTLPALAALLDKTQALENILNIASNIQGLEKKILTNTQYEYKRNESEITRYTLPEYIYNRKSNMISTIKNRMKAHGIPIPQKPQDQAAGAGASSAESNMKEFKNLTQDQQTLFQQLTDTIRSGKCVAYILEQYKSKNKDSYAKDIEAVTVFSPLGRTLLIAVVYLKNLEALEDILDAVSNIEGLEKKILTEVQCKNFDGKDYTLLGYAALYTSPNEENPANKIVKIINNRMEANGIPIPQKQQNQAAGPDPVINSPESPSFLSQHKGKILVADLLCTIVGVVLLYAGNPLGGIALLAGALLLLATTKEGQKMYGEVGKTLYNVLPKCLKSKEAAKG